METTLAEKHWPSLVLKYTVDGACNFQRAANELAEIVASAERAACAGECDKIRDMEGDDVAGWCASAIRARSKGSCKPTTEAAKCKLKQMRAANRPVWLLTTGTGADGDEWNVESIHATEAGANRAKAEFEKPRTRPDESTYILEAMVEEWDLEE